MERNQFGLLRWDSRVILHPALGKRFTWIAKCASAASGTIHMFFDRPHIKYVYFMELKKIWAPFEYSWGWGINIVSLSRSRCFYLGRYDYFWDFYWQKPVAPHDYGKGELLPIGSAPFIPEYAPEPIGPSEWMPTWWKSPPMQRYIPEAYRTDRETMEFFHGKYLTSNYFTMADWLKRVRTMYLQCCRDAYYRKFGPQYVNEVVKPYDDPTLPPPAEQPPAPGGAGPARLGEKPKTSQLILQLDIQGELGTMLAALHGSLTGSIQTK